MKNYLQNKKRIFLVPIFLFIAFCVLQFISYTLTNTLNLQKDFTQSGSYTLSKSSIELSKNLTEDITINVLANEEKFKQASPYFNQVNELLKQYKRYSDKIKVEFIDFETNPNFLKNYENITLVEGDILITSLNKNVPISANSLFNLTFSEESIDILSSKAESTISSAILSIVSPSQKTIGFLTSNDTYPTDSIKEKLTQNNYLNVDLDLSQVVPNNVDVLFLFSPKTDLSSEEIKNLTIFSNTDKKTVIYVADTQQPANMANINSFLNSFGVNIGEGLIVESDTNLIYNQNPYMSLLTYENYTYAGALSENKIYPLIPFSMPLTATENKPENITVSNLLKFSDTVHIQPNDASTDWKPSDATLASGTLGMTLSQKTNQSELSNLVVIPSASFFDDYIFGDDSIANGNYFISLLNNLTDRTDVIPMTFNSLNSKLLKLPQSASQAITLFFLIFLPLIIVVTGFFVLNKRNKNTIKKNKNMVQ